MTATRISPPENLSPDHDITHFDSGEPSLDDWLLRRAVPNEASGASRTYIACCGDRVAGYYTLAVGAAHANSPGRIKRNMPDPVPVMILARLAVDRSFQGQGLGRSLLADAVKRTSQAAEIAGIRALLVHAISATARDFYEKHGFRSSPIDPMTLMITIAEATRHIENAKRR